MLAAVVIALVLVSSASARVVHLTVPRFQSAPHALTGGQTAVVSAFVKRNASCRLVVQKARVKVTSARTRSRTGYLEFVWQVPKTVAPGAWQAMLQCKGSRHTIRRTIQVPRHGGSRRAPIARHIRVITVLSAEPPSSVTGYGASGYPPYGSVMVPASAWFGGHGVDVISNGFNDNICQTSLPCYYQCVELVNRFLTSEGFGPSIYGNADQLYDNVAASGNYQRYYVPHPNGSGYYPVPGDIVVEKGGGYGHVSVVSAVSGSVVYTVEQNASSSGVGQLTLRGSTLSLPYGVMSVEGLLHAKANTNPPGSGPPPPPPIHYQPFVGDFNGDGIPDIGLRDANTGIFFIKHGPSYNDQISYQWAAGSNYQPFVGDFNGDGQADIGLRDVNTGTIFIKHGPSFSDQISYQWAPGGNYQIFAGDFNGDGQADIGLRDSATGIFFIKHGPSFNDQISYQWAAGSNYQPFVGDFNGDRLADIGLRDVNTGTWFIKHGPSFNDQVSYQWAAGANYQPLVGDWDRDGEADIGLRDASIGTLYFLTTQTVTTYGNQTTYPWAAGSNYSSFEGDFDGDGNTDIGLRDSATGIFFIKHGPSFNDQVSYQWAAGSNYQAFVGDFNGDGLTDIGLRDTATGIFFIKYGPTFNNQLSFQWVPGANYQPVIGDWDHDGKADIGLRDSNNGIFYFLTSTTTTTFGNQTTYPWASG